MTDDWKPGDEPTKAAIERAKAFKDAVPSTSATYNTYGSSFTAFARHLDQVSETAINALSFVSQFNDEPADVCADALQALILPDPEPAIAGKTLDEWREFARRDDCLDRMVPSDLRQLISAITKTGEAGHDR